MLNYQLLKKIKDQLPPKYAETIKEQLGVSVSKVYGVVMGKTDDIKVVNALIKLAKENAKKRKQVIEQAELL